MTRSKRILYVIEGIIMILFSGLLAAYPDIALNLVMFIVGVGMTLRGLRTLFYYFTMARYMVGGKLVLYHSFIFLDAGALITALAKNPVLSAAVYISFIHAFAGLVDVLRSFETRKLGAKQWKWTAMFGAAQILMAVLVFISGVFWKRADMMVYVYAFGLLLAAVNRIITAFRRTMIVYIP